MQFKHISIVEAHQLIIDQSTQIVDIRDEHSYSMGHMPGAINLNNANIQEYIASADLDAPLLVVCYHGNASQSAALYLAEQGFEDVYSLDGGIEAWRIQFPITRD